MNMVRGEVPLVVSGKTYVLCLTLGALAELEEKLGIESLAKIDEVFKSPKASQVIDILVALLHGGADEEGEDRQSQVDLTAEDLKRWKLIVTDAMEAMTAAFKGSTATEEEAKTGKK